MKNIYLNADRKNWSLPINHGVNLDLLEEGLTKIRKKIIKRDGYKCYFCDFKAKHYQEIHHVDGNHKNNTENNLVTICPFCHQNFHLLNASVTGGGKIIYLPEITQVQLNHLCRTLFVLLKQEKIYEEMASAAKSTFSSLESRASLLENDFAVGSSDPATFAQALLRIQKKGNKIDKKRMSYFKMLPYYARFYSQIDYWSKSVYKKIPVDEWHQYIPEGFDPNTIFNEETDQN